MIAQPDTGAPEGLRDRAILETFYATGMRRMEVANLKLYDLDAERGTVMIRQGKGKKDRHIPIGERALAWIGKYIREARPGLLAASEDGTVFLTDAGLPFHRKQLTSLVRSYLRKSKIGKMGGCHLFRHTVATLMLENGADIRVIQELLGHAKLSTTELYTRVSINLLKQVYAATHPAASLKPPKRSYDRIINGASPHERSGSSQELCCRAGEGAARRRGHRGAQSPARGGAARGCSRPADYLGLHRASRATR